jgi:hypothetical protein
MCAREEVDLVEVKDVSSETAAAIRRAASDDTSGQMAGEPQPGDQHSKRTVHGDRWSAGLDWSAVVWIALIHIGALAAPLVFTHAFHRSARHGHRWWELDLTYIVIRLMKAIGLAWDVVLFCPD